MAEDRIQRTVLLRLAKGTPAPWNPSEKLVIRGPPRSVRNPMITGALLILLPEAILFQYWPMAVWNVFDLKITDNDIRILTRTIWR
jgi:hypothetical protein